jgi:hypothetical protein
MWLILSKRKGSPHCALDFAYIINWISGIGKEIEISILRISNFV